MSKQHIEFGTGGWRGIIGDTFTKENIQKVTYSCLDFIGENGILVAKDRRFLSDEAMEWVLEVLYAYDRKVFVVESPVPTPTVMHCVKVNNFDLGIMITASHNPSSYNGIKIIMPKGRDANLQLTKILEEKANQVTHIETVRVDNNRIKYIYPNNDYVESVLSNLDYKAIRKKHYKVAVDIMHSVSYRLIPMLLGNIGVEFDMIRNERDPLFDNETPAPSDETLKKLKLLMSKSSYDLGIATDADGDRIGLLDESGNYVDANTILAILYEYLLDKGERGGVVRNMSTTHLVDVIAKAHHENYFEEPVGFKNISESMSESDALIGGESSGGITTRDHIDGKDGIYSSLLILEMMSYYDLPLSKIIQKLEDKYGRYYNVEKEYKLTKEIYLETTKNIIDYYSKDSSVSINLRDGLKIIINDNTWFTFRESGTEALTRFFIESKNEETLYKLISLLENKLMRGG